MMKAGQSPTEGSGRVSRRRSGQAGQTDAMWMESISHGSRAVSRLYPKHRKPSGYGPLEPLFHQPGQAGQPFIKHALASIFSTGSSSQLRIPVKSTHSLPYKPSQIFLPTSHYHELSSVSVHQAARRQSRPALTTSHSSLPTAVSA